MTSSSAWVVERHGGPAGALHALDPPSPARRTLWVLEPDRPALVLGSTQRPAPGMSARLAAEGIDLVVRRSGGGAVLLVPGEVAWLDLVVPRHDPLWDDDVHRAAAWVADAWVAALAALGVPARRHEGGSAPGRWGGTVCFAGFGPGEVVDAAGAKLVGVSQRRTRAWARFQCLLHLRHDAAALLAALGSSVPAAERDELVAHLQERVAVAAVPGGTTAVAAALHTTLPI